MFKRKPEKNSKMKVKAESAFSVQESPTGQLDLPAALGGSGGCLSDSIDGSDAVPSDVNCGPMVTGPIGSAGGRDGQSGGWLSRWFDFKQIGNTVLLVLTLVAVLFLLMLNLETSLEIFFYALGALLIIFFFVALCSSFKCFSGATARPAYQLSAPVRKGLRSSFLLFCTLLIGLGTVQGAAAMRCCFLEAQRFYHRDSVKPSDLAVSKRAYEELANLFPYFHSPGFKCAFIQTEFYCKHYSEAMALSDQILASEPDDVHALTIKLAACDRLGERQKWLELVSRLQKLPVHRAQSPGFHPGLFMQHMARTSMADNRLQDALVYSDLALHFLPEKADIYRLRASVLEKLGRADEAAGDLKRAGDLQEHLHSDRQQESRKP